MAGVGPRDPALFPGRERLSLAKKTKKKAKESASEAPAHDLPSLPFHEILAVLFGTVGIFVLLALLSFHPSDPSWDAGGDVGPALNWMGPFGAYVAEALVVPLGLASLVVPVVLLLAAGSLLRNRVPGWPLIRLVAALALTVFTCGLLAWYPGTILFRGDMVEAGGLVGAALERSLEAHLARGGTLIAMLAGLVIAAQITLAIRIGPPLLKLGGLVKRLVVGGLRLGAAALTRGASHTGQAAVAGASALGKRLKRPGPGPARTRGGTPERPRPRPVERSRKSGQAPETAASPDEAGVGLDKEGDLVGAGVSAPAHPAPAKATSRGGPGGVGAPRIVKSRYMEEQPGGSAIVVPPEEPPGEYKFPSTSFLALPARSEAGLSEEELLESARALESKLLDYGVEGRVVEIHPGPVITMYEYAPAPGVKVSKITNLSNDLALALRALAVRIVAPLPGKAAVGIEVPNRSRQVVHLREIVEHESFVEGKHILPLAIGKDIEGKPYTTDLAKMPHLLVAGATGTGKSVAVNAMLMSLFYSRTPDEVRIILIDPKIIEFSVYEDIPHLLMPVVTEPQKAARALGWAVNEMTRRYKLLTSKGARNIASYNKIVQKELDGWERSEHPEGAEPPEKLSYIVVVIDELADLMMVAGKEVQDAIVRLAQMARAAGIHMIIATQRPSVDVITGLIKANFPARIAFKVSSKTDSRTIIDANGAECLLGNGDMLFVPPGTANVIRLHGAFVSDDETRAVIEHLRAQGKPQYEASLLQETENAAENGAATEDDDYDEKYEEAKLVVLEAGVASISTIQRRLKIGYNRSARMVERMAREGLIGPPTLGGKPREIFPDRIQASLR